MGVLHTGYLEKYNPANRHTKKRFVVLTHVGLHWFKVCQCISEYLGHLQVDQKTTYYSKNLSDAGSSRGLSITFHMHMCVNLTHWPLGQIRIRILTDTDLCSNLLSLQRESGYDLFGEERGSLNVGELTKCTMTTDSACTFEVRANTRW
jgi:hypothetical protein